MSKKALKIFAKVIKMRVKFVKLKRFVDYWEKRGYNIKIGV